MASPDPTAPAPDHPANKLANETSPYLLQHAHNPVQWYPWGDEAIERARLEDKPIFLSVGYSTCYWCHVMERESFENETVAEVLNTYFISIKVDREERPDVDDVYMTAVQVMTGRGGWPMSVFIEPMHMQPFFGGTYFPPKDQSGRPGFLTLLDAIHQAWNDPEKRPQLEDGARRLAEEVRKRLAEAPPPSMPGPDVVDAAVAQIMSTYDATDAGYGAAPKFPMPANLDLLIEAGWDRPEVQASITHTLDRMAMGGMYDQIGGGFHRYSTDGKWLVPHFEKMLYDNGQLASIYAQAGQLADNGFHKAIADEIAQYVLRDMRDATGAFWSAQDAESNAREGETYIWTPVEVEAVLRKAGMNDDTIAFAKRSFGMEGAANFRDPHHASDPKWVLHLPEHPSKLAEAAGLTGREFHTKLLPIMAALKAVRDGRDQPITDDKVLAGWNGLMIGGLADTGRVLGKTTYITAAAEAATAIHSRMWSSTDGLLRTMRAGEGRIPAFLEDYALLAKGVLALYQATQDEQWLTWAKQLMEQARGRFWTDDAGWFDMPDGDDDLFVRGRSLYDGALPSGTSTVLWDLVELYAVTGDATWLEQANETARTIGTVLQRSPRSMPIAAAALHRLAKLQSTAVVSTAKPFTAGVVTASIEGLPQTLAPGASVNVSLVFDIQPKWHLTLPGEDDEFAMPLRIESGDAAYTLTVDMPGGRPFHGPTGELRVLEGHVEIPIQVQCTASSESPVSIIVTWQACDDAVCQAPATHRFGADE